MKKISSATLLIYFCNISPCIAQVEKSAVNQSNVLVSEFDTTNVLCDNYWTWNCRKCGTTNVQEANRCSNCKSAR